LRYAAPVPLICAFIANAASFVLPISNPANLVVYASKMPPLGTWLRSFALPSVLSISATYIAPRLLTRNELRGEMVSEGDRPVFSSAGRWAAYGIIATAVVLILASALEFDLGLPTHSLVGRGSA
jgi:arsenical pump membrane protein